MSAINCILVHSVPCLCPRTIKIGWVASSGFWMLVQFNEQLKENCLLNLNIINMLRGTNCSWDHCGWLRHQITFSGVNRITYSDLMLMFWFFWRATQKVHQFSDCGAPWLPPPTPTVRWFRPIFCASMNLHIEEFGGKSTIMMAQLPLVPNSLSKEKEST